MELLSNSGKDMKRIAFLYECRYRNDGPPLYLKTAFDRNKELLGLEDVRHWIPIKEDMEAGRWGKVDLFIWPDAGEDALGMTDFICPKPNAYWASDTHLGMDYRLKKAEEFDYVFLTIPRHIEKFKKHLGHDRVFYLPHAGEPTCYTKKAVIKRHDVCFIGHLPTEERIELLDRLFKDVPDFFYGQKFFEEASSKYNESKLVFNHCIDKEANMRVFEGTLSGSAMLCNYSQDVADLGYEDGKNIIFYHDADDLVKKAKFYIEHDAAREQIADAGLLHTMKYHTYLHRAAKIMEVVRDGKC